MEIKNCKYSSEDNSTVDCEINHPEYGWIPTTVFMIGDDRPELVKKVELEVKEKYVKPEKTQEEKEKEVKYKLIKSEEPLFFDALLDLLPAEFTDRVADYRAAKI